MSPAGRAPQPASRRVALVVEYDGTGYLGFQLQAGQPTIQGEMERALLRFTGESIRIRAASRTDSGAHARGQVVDFLTGSPHPAQVFPAALNFYLPAEIKVQAAYEVATQFHSRKDASSRTYRYNILNRPWPSPLARRTCLWVREPLDVAWMASAARGLVGIRDFRPLAPGYPPGQSTVRTVHRWDVWREQDTVIIECQADGFLRHLIRLANGLLVAVGRGQQPEGVINDLLHGKLDGGPPRCSLPARGLCLMRVTYPNVWSQVRAADEKE